MKGLSHHYHAATENIRKTLGNTVGSQIRQVYFGPFLECLYFPFGVNGRASNMLWAFEMIYHTLKCCPQGLQDPPGAFPEGIHTNRTLYVHFLEGTF